MGLGFFEICIIALFVLIFFGPQRLPEMMREAGKFFVHVKRLSNEVKGHFETIMNEAEASILAEEEKKRTIKKLPASPSSSPPDSEAYHPEKTSDPETPKV